MNLFPRHTKFDFEQDDYERDVLGYVEKRFDMRLYPTKKALTRDADANEIWLKADDFKEKFGWGGTHYYERKDVPESDVPVVKDFCASRGYTYKICPAEYARSDDYRDKFFAENKPILTKKEWDGHSREYRTYKKRLSDVEYYRCSYCGKLVPKKKVQVDHIYPVYKMMESQEVRDMAKKHHGIESTNDLKNLTTACVECNRVKGAKMGKWIAQGFRGQCEEYWRKREARRWLYLCLGVFAGIYIVAARSGVLYEPPAVTEFFNLWMSALGF